MHLGLQLIIFAVVQTFVLSKKPPQKTKVMSCLEPKLFILFKKMVQNQQIFTSGTRMVGLAFALTPTLKNRRWCLVKVQNLKKISLSLQKIKKSNKYSH